MNREQAKEIIKRDISCSDFLERSKNNMFCCPVCNSGHGNHGTGAVKYYPSTNTWHCHACEQGGDVIDAYRLQNACDYNTALLYLAARAGITIDSPQNIAAGATASPQNDGNRKSDAEGGKDKKGAQNENNGQTPADYRAYYEICRARLDDPQAAAYLQARGISIDTAAACGIGYDPQADPAGAPGAMGDEYKAHPAPRLIIPTTAAHYVGRRIDGLKEFDKVNAKGSSPALFNAAAIYSGAGVVFVTEGAFDALSFAEAGAAAVALNSKGNGKLLIKQLQEKQTAAAFVIVPDNDSNPDTAADTMKRAHELNSALQGMDYNSIVYNVAGEYHDANDALKADAAAFKSGIDAAIKELSRDDITDFLEKIQTEAYKPHRTGLNFFDKLLGGGIVQQSILLLMAAPGTGKTTLAQQLAETIAENGHPVLFINFEMSREQLLAKAISAKLYKRGINKTMLDVLQGYKWDIAERADIEATIEDYRRNNYPRIKYNPTGATSDLNTLLSFLQAAGAKAEAAGETAPAIIIDYLHLITSAEKIENAELIKQSLIGLKQYAVRYNTFVIAISATNRDSMKNGRIMLYSGRDSSNIEFTGDYVLSLNYADIDSGKVKPDDIEKISELQRATRRYMILRALKTRADATGDSVKIMYDAAHNTFYGAADDFIPPAGFTFDDGAPAF